MDDFGNDKLLAQLREVFFEESEEGLSTMEAILVDQDGSTALDAESINSMFRVMHSIKGGAGTIGLSSVVRVAHAAETFLDAARAGEVAIGHDDRTQLLQILDHLGLMIQGAKSGEAVDDSAALAIASKLQGEPVVESGTTEDSKQRFRVRLDPSSELMSSGNDPYRLFLELDDGVGLDVMAIDDHLPSLHELDPTQLFLRWQLTTKEPCERSEIDDVFSWIDDLAKIEVEAYAPPPSANKAADTPEGGAPPAKPANASSIRVQIGKVDRLMNLVGELVITQSMLSQLSGSEEGTRSERWLQGLSQLQRNTRDLQESVMGIRMVPMSFLFSRFPRMVRDLSTKLDKQVRLEIIGESNELDRTLVERLSDPLVHLVRNAIDHGLETSSERAAAGKAPEGRIGLRAFQQGDKMLVEVRDDGRGINHERILAKAVDRGLVDDPSLMTREQALQLILEPGFSTADQVSDLSGRGVGLDVVRKNVNAMGGSLEVQSTPGEGSTFVLKLPLTLAITDGQLVTIGDQTFVIPVLSIVESVQRDVHEFTPLPSGGLVTEFRGAQVHVVDGARAMGRDGGERRARGTYVIVEDGGAQVAVGVDELLGQQQVVVKNLEENFRRVPGVSGATILGDGKVALIMEVSELAGGPAPSLAQEEVAVQ